MTPTIYEQFQRNFHNAISQSGVEPNVMRLSHKNAFRLTREFMFGVIKNAPANDAAFCILNGCVRVLVDERVGESEMKLSKEWSFGMLPNPEDES